MKYVTLCIISYQWVFLKKGPLKGRVGPMSIEGREFHG